MGKILGIFDNGTSLVPGEPFANLRGPGDFIFQQSIFDEVIPAAAGDTGMGLYDDTPNANGEVFWNKVIYTGSETLGLKKDPFKGSNFIVGFIPLQVNSVTNLIEEGSDIFWFGFKMLSGLKFSTASTEYRESGDDAFKHNVPATSTFEKIKLQKAMWQDTNFLYRWGMLNVQIKGQSVTLASYADYRCNILIGIRDKGLQVKKFIKVFDGFVESFEVGDMDSMSDDILLESIEIAHEGFQFGSIPDTGDHRSFVPLPLSTT